MPDLDLLRGLSDQVIPPPPDALRETARRRTRRAATSLTVVAAVAVAVVIGGSQFTTTHDASAPPPGDQPPSERDNDRPLTYAEGAEVHYGDRDVTMADRVVELDLTDDGVVVRTADNRVWFTDGGAVDEISDIGESGGGDDESGNGDVLWGSYVGRVVTSNYGSEVAWYEYPRPHSPEAVVYDTEAGQVLHRYPVEVPSGVGSGLYSVDSEALYGFTDLTYGEALRPNWRIALDTGKTKPMFEDGQYQSVLRRRG